MTPGRSLDLGCPVEWGHPFSRSLMGEWAAAPQSPGWGGLYLRDMVRVAKTPHDGLLSNKPTWGGSLGFPGSPGAILFTRASSQDAQMGTNVSALRATGTNWHFLAWVQFTGSTGLGGDNKEIVSSLDANHGEWQLKHSAATGLLRLITWSSAGYGGQTTLEATNFGVLANGPWYFVEAWSDGSNLGVAVNGVTTTVAYSSGFYSGGSPVFELASQAPFGEYLDGYIAQALWYQRALSRSEADALRLETAAGNPNRWRWYTPRTWFYGGTADVFVPVGARNIQIAGPSVIPVGGPSTIFRGA